MPVPQQGSIYFSASVPACHPPKLWLMPSLSCPHLCGATLLASHKKSGGFHPIAIVRSLTSKCLSAHILPLVKQMLPPHQVGVGTKKGAEALVHSLKLLLSNSSIASQSKCCLLLDFSNAFNSIDCSVLFQEVRSKIPAFSPWLKCCYGAQPHLLEFSRETPLAPLHSHWSFTPSSRGFRWLFQVFSSMGGSWMMALYAAPLRISLLLCTSWRKWSISRAPP